MKLQIGNIVRLASGGPKMTVDRINQNPTNDLVRCVWFSGDNIRDASFSVESLEIVKPSVDVFPVFHSNYDNDNDLFFPDYDHLG